MLVDARTVDLDSLVEQIARLEVQLFGPGAWTPGMVRDELSAPARTYLLDIPAADGRLGSPAAEGSSSMAQEDPVNPHAALGDMHLRAYGGFWFDGEDAELMTIGVEAAQQGRGIGARLLEALIGRARQQGATRMLLEVRVDNGPALALYDRFGFRRLGLRKRYYQPENVDAYTMALDLAPRLVGFSGQAPEGKEGRGL
ncbi:ribosomal-protein-alanine N-acetyltransferase [Bifidobacterium aemilianum]|uniref:Ribosomal-protein-alanine N-acetyltransferase n=1 Tax=Bifidobacterium aemilianum TaxID=2493120 RepID=A0A366KBX2_9BIFI|nr:ribosomal protein S18-alanine N-acetyltransferase [Bifidobacterium aemilianum]RBP98151.1 ribosomal-protein-alanine N-acetyltransferase [Bifidobacterium aemilianum]